MSREKKGKSASLLRTASMLRDEISQILLRDINDDRIGFISLTYVKLSTDRAHAWIYYSQIGSDEQKEKTKRGLSSATSYIHGELSKRIRYMAIPKLHFRFDQSIERGIDLSNKIDGLSASL